MVKCHKCGQALPKEAVFCGYCGVKLRKVKIDLPTIDTIKSLKKVRGCMVPR